MHNTDKLQHLVDPMLCRNFSGNEAVRFLKVGLLCVQEKSSLRPRMSTVIEMINGDVNINDDVEIWEPGLINDIMDVKLRY